MLISPLIILIKKINQSLVGSMVIDVELGMKDHCSILKILFNDKVNLKNGDWFEKYYLMIKLILQRHSNV
jgi:hypothetical protein